MINVIDRLKELSKQFHNSDYDLRRGNGMSDLSDYYDGKTAGFDDAGDELDSLIKELESGNASSFEAYVGEVDFDESGTNIPLYVSGYSLPDEVTSEGTKLKVTVEVIEE